MYLPSYQKAACDGPRTREASTGGLAVQAALPLGPYDPVGPKVCKVSVSDKDLVWSHSQALQINDSSEPLVFGAKHCYLLWLSTLLLRNSFWFALDRVLV